MLSSHLLQSLLDGPSPATMLASAIPPSGP